MHTNQLDLCRAWRLISRLALMVVLGCLISQHAHAQNSNPETFSYPELVQLSEQPIPSEPLQLKLTTLLTTAFISNKASERGVKPLKPNAAQLGEFLRIAFWNIERGLQYQAIEKALGGSRTFTTVLRRAKQAKGVDRAAVLREAGLLSQADVIVLNEVDWGLKRTDYRNVAADLAAALGMNYAYGVEFVEVDPLTLGLEKFEEVDPKQRAELLAAIKVDPARYKGLHGTAILSRYRLENVRLIPLKLQPHNWYEDEKKGTAPVEKGKRKLAEQVFLEKIYRQVRRGGRMMLTADLVDPQFPSGRVRIVATHLEDRTTPKNREKQLEELLQVIKQYNYPVVLAGDMNTSGEDATPTSFKREITKRLGSKSFWINRGISYATGVGFVKDIVFGGVKYVRNQSDPTVKNVPVVAPNPAAGFFDTLKDFRFSDGGAFDFRGEVGRSIGNSNETLGNSNERGNKGFLTTYEVERRIGSVGKMKLDWFFIKPPGLSDPNDKNQPHLFAPHFGRTLKDLNYSIEDRISDHSPIVVDLPLTEPRIIEASTKKN
ncbi:MAG TPA: endonuclease/exonuclease/phosphatase family protein [Pyrinomonadaceae bacterium]|nr:endonuclease/exonuclease/phosphatase family protein [Pyrinomonadaceae bacterium]